MLQYTKGRFKIRVWNNFMWGYLNNGHTKLIDLGYLQIMINRRQNG